jgi:nucleoside-diphosphate-sugar epimerase
MRVFVTGASGWIGSAVTRELLAHGHSVLGLARSEESAKKVEALGADVHRGDLGDPVALRAGAEHAEGVIHLGYNHDFSDMPGAARLDRGAIDIFGEALAGTGRPLLIASGVAGLTTGGIATEGDTPDPASHPRVANAMHTIELAARDIRTAVVRFAPTVHGTGDKGFIAFIVGCARERGVSPYIGDGSSRWPAVHVNDAANLVRLALEQAPAGTVVHATAEQGVTSKAIAESIGRGLELPAQSISPADAPSHFGWMASFFGRDLPTSSTITRRRFGWNPTHPTLIEDLDAGHYY